MANAGRDKFEVFGEGVGFDRLVLAFPPDICKLPCDLMEEERECVLFMKVDEL